MNDFQPHLSQPYLSVRGQFEAFTGANTTQGAFNQLSGSVYNLKSSYELPNDMYRAVSSMEFNARQQLGGLEQRF